MKINKISLKNFRNHKDLKLDMDGKSHLILGDNGVGKTNILEAIHLLATTKSLRATYDVEMIAHGNDFARIDAEIEPNGDKKLLEMIISRTQRSENTSTKKVKLDKVNKSLNNFAGNLNTVLFTPHDVELFNSTPSLRRRHIDALFFQIDKKYKKAISDYKKAIRQRNKLLEQIREFGIGRDQLDYWTEKVMENGEIIQEKRNEYLEFVNNMINDLSSMLNDVETDYEIKYIKNELTKERLENYASAEVAAARTLIGPHRDDFLVTINGHDISKFGSRGQKRTAILALKLCEIDFIENQLGRRPVLLLDDIFSELDDEHKEAVLKIVKLQQTLITTADKTDLRNGMPVIQL